MDVDHHISVEVNGRAIDTWTDYDLDSDLLTPTDGFRLTFAAGGEPARRRELKALLVKGSRVKIFAVHEGARSLQLSGVLEEIQTTTTRESGTIFSVEGRDLACFLVDSSCKLGLQQIAATFAATVRNAVQEFGLEVVVDNSANRDLMTGRAVRVPESLRNRERARVHGVDPSSYSRSMQRRAARQGIPLDQATGDYAVATSDAVGTSTDSARVTRAQARAATARRTASNGLSPGDVERLRVDEARPQASETVWEYLDRHARRLGLLMWMTCDGKLVLSAPRYDQPPSARFVLRDESRDEDPNNVLSATVIENVSESYSVVKAFGRGRSDASLARPAIGATVVDPDLPPDFHKTLIVRDKSIRSSNDAVRLANREMAKHKLKGLVVNVVVPNHGQNGLLYATDTIATVVNEPAGVDEDMYVVSRTFRRSREHGTTTELRLVKKGAIVL